MAPRQRPKKREYVNRTQGWLGAITIDRKGDERPVAVEPNGRIFLTDEEVELTARSHATKAASPFEPQEITWYYAPTGKAVHTFTAAPLTLADELPEGPLQEHVALREEQAREAQQMATL